MNIDNVIKNLNTQNDTHIVIGVSAGPDSMALLHSAITNLNKTMFTNKKYCYIQFQFKYKTEQRD